MNKREKIHYFTVFVNLQIRRVADTRVLQVIYREYIFQTMHAFLSLHVIHNANYENYNKNVNST